MRDVALEDLRRSLACVTKLIDLVEGGLFERIDDEKCEAVCRNLHYIRNLAHNTAIAAGKL